MSVNVWYEKEIKEMIQEVTKANSKEKVEELFDRILTPREINDMARRLKILKLLKGGKSYLEIQDTLRVSPSIISRLSAKIGFGFRRVSSKTVPSRSGGGRKYKKPAIRYKGAAPIHRMFD